MTDVNQQLTRWQFMSEIWHSELEISLHRNLWLKKLAKFGSFTRFLTVQSAKFVLLPEVSTYSDLCLWSLEQWLGISTEVIYCLPTFQGLGSTYLHNWSKYLIFRFLPLDVVKSYFLGKHFYVNTFTQILISLNGD